MDPAWSVVVLLLSCVFGSPVPSLDVNRGVQPVDDRPIPIDSNSTGLYEDRYDENTTLLNHNSTRMTEDQYVDKSPLLDSISTGKLNSNTSDYVDNSTLMDNKYTRDYDILLANRNNTGNSTGLAKENNDEIKVQVWNISRMEEESSLISPQKYRPTRCFLSTCLVHHLPNILQSGDETAGDRTQDMHGPG